MANSQLKFHLLREVIDEMGGNYCDEALLGSLLLAGKESAAALRWIVARDVHIHRKFGDEKSYQLWIKWGMWQRNIESAYFKNFALRNTKCLKIDDNRDTIMKLVNVASACSRLSVLDCPSTHFLAMLNTNVDLSNLYEATLHVQDLVQCSSILSYLTHQPERCPNMDTLVISSCFFLLIGSFIMTNNQLKWHLLKEMSVLLMKKFTIKDVTPLSHFLMSGKDPAVAVRILLSDVYLSESESDQNTALLITDSESCQKVTIRWNEKFYDIQPAYFQKLVFLLAHSVCLSTSKFHLECPNVENFALDMVDWAVDDIMEMISNYYIPTVKSLHITADAQCCTPIDFSELSVIPNIFRNIEKVSLTVELFCEHDSNEISLEAYERICDDFEKFDPPFAFDFTYAPDNNYEHHEGLEPLLLSMGLHKNVKDKLYWQFYKFRKSYPTKSLTIQYDE